MNLTQVASGGIFYEAADGRIVFRPWGKRGPCYLLTPAQRLVRARIQLGYYGFMLVVITLSTLRLGSVRTFAIALPAILAGNYLLFGLFARGLPTTDPPGPPPPGYTNELIRRHNRAFGKPLLWVMFTLSLLMAAAGVWAGLRTGAWRISVLSGGFFGLCAAAFAWQLKNQ